MKSCRLEKANQMNGIIRALGNKYINYQRSTKLVYHSYTMQKISHPKG